MRVDIPNVGDTVTIQNQQSGETITGTVAKVMRPEDFGEGDESVYLEIDEAPGQEVQFKIGTYHGEEFSWAMRETDTMETFDLTPKNAWTLTIN